MKLSQQGFLLWWEFLSFIFFLDFIINVIICPFLLKSYYFLNISHILFCLIRGWKSNIASSDECAVPALLWTNSSQMQQRMCYEGKRSPCSWRFTYWRLLGDIKTDQRMGNTPQNGEWVVLELIHDLWHKHNTTHQFYVLPSDSAI